jgi:hypothetical protein
MSLPESNPSYRPSIDLTDRRSWLRKTWDRLPWSWYARTVRKWRKAARK